MEAKRIGILNIHHELFLSALGLPPDTEILAVRDDGFNGVIQVRIEHPGLQPIMPGCAIPNVDAVVTRQDGHPVFKGWM